MTKRTTSWAAAAALLATAGAAPAALVKNGDGTITDTSTQLIWLQNWRVTGRQAWATQKAWAENLHFAGSSDWALPSIDDYIDLHAELGGVIVAGGFAQVQADFYWADTQVVAGSRAWVFHPMSGATSGLGESLAFHAVAVRRGDVAAPVPEPQTLALTLLALGAAALTLRRRPAHDGDTLGIAPRGSMPGPQAWARWLAGSRLSPPWPSGGISPAHAGRPPQPLPWPWMAAASRR